VEKKYKYGLVCISEKLKHQDKALAFRSMTRKSFLNLREQYVSGQQALSAEYVLQERILHNIRLTQKTLLHCHDNNIFHYRLSSNLFPLITDPTLNLQLEDFVGYGHIVKELKEIGKIANKYNISISIHPDQFNVLASKRDDVVQKTIRELNFHSKILDIIGLPQDYSAPINIHPSVSTKAKDEKEKSLQEIVDRFYEGFKQCDQGVQKRLVVENEDKGVWNCGNLFMYFYNYCGTKHGHFFPLTYDNLHDHCNPTVFEGKAVTQEQNIQAFAGTWNKNTPIFHFSWGKKENSRSHADYASENIPSYDMQITWEIELKAKDFAIERLQNWGQEAQDKEQIEPKIKEDSENSELSQNLSVDKQQQKDHPNDSYNHVYGINT